MRGPFAEFARRLVILLAAVFVGDRVLAAIARDLLTDSGIRFARLYGGPDADIVVLGDSRAVNAFYAPEVSRVTGRSALNLGYNGVSTRVAEAMLRDYLEHHGPPRLVIVEGTCTTVPDTAIDALRGFWSNDGAVAELARELRADEYLATQIVALYGFNGEGALRGFYYLGRSDQDWVNRYRISSEVLEAASHQEPFDLSPTRTNLDALQRIASLLHERQIPMRVVVSPYLPVYAQHIRNRAEFLAEVERAAGGHVEDYADSLADIELFSDRLHMNERGAVAFVQRLSADGAFTGLRGESAAAHVDGPETE